MKKEVLFAAAVCLFAACSSNSEETVTNQEPTEVTLTFSPYQMDVMTRAATSIANVVTKLDVWIYESGTEVQAIHQTSTNDNFGTVTATLDKTKNYTLYAVGHKADGVTLSNGVIAFADEKVTHSMFYSTTFTPATSTTLNCEMTRIIGLFKMTTTDEVPTDVVKMEFALGTTPTRWNVAGYGTNSTERTATFENFSRNQTDGTASFFVYIIASPAESTNYNITATAYKANNSVKQTRTFTDVPIRNGYRTQYQGSFFIDTPMSMSFVVDDWNDYDVVNF